MTLNYCRSNSLGISRDFSCLGGNNSWTTHSICVKLLHKHDKLTQCCRAFTLALARLSCNYICQGYTVCTFVFLSVCVSVCTADCLCNRWDGLRVDWCALAWVMSRVLGNRPVSGSCPAGRPIAMWGTFQKHDVICAHSVPLVWMGRMTYCLPRNVFDSCMKSWHYFRMDKILLETSFYRLSDDIVRFKIEVEVGVYEKCTKM